MRLSWTLRKSSIGSKSLGILARILWRVRVPIFFCLLCRIRAHFCGSRAAYTYIHIILNCVAFKTLWCREYGCWFCSVRISPFTEGEILSQMKVMMKTLVVNKYKDEYDVYIGRGSKWGNPFVIGKDGSREEVIVKYEKMLSVNVELLSVLLCELEGMRLGCFCKPSACHGDVLVEYIERMRDAV